MKRFLLTLLTVALAAALILFLAAPITVRQIRLRENAQAASGYRTATDELSLLDCSTLLARAQDHNKALDSAPWTDPFAVDTADGSDGYAALLNPAGDGVMAILEAPKLGITLAVYHGGGPADARLTHAPQSRLPSGNTDGPCVLYAARERFFDPLTNLNRLIAGDCFFLRVLQDTATYEVFEVATLSPRALEALEVVEDEEECALVAQTGDGNRLVVRGRRVPRQSAKPVDDTATLPGGIPELMLAAPVAAVGLAALAVVEWLRRAVRRSKRRRMKL